MSGTRSDAWQQLIEYSRQMLEKAEAGEWETLTTMAEERQRRFEAFFAEPVSPELTDEVAAGIQRIGDIDDAVTALARDASREFSAEHEVFRKRKQASEAYSAPHHRER